MPTAPLDVRPLWFDELLLTALPVVSREFFGNAQLELGPLSPPREPEATPAVAGLDDLAVQLC